MRVKKLSAYLVVAALLTLTTAVFAASDGVDVNWNSGMGYKWYDFDYDGTRRRNAEV